MSKWHIKCIVHRLRKSRRISCGIQKNYARHCREVAQCCFTLLHSDATQTAWHLPLLHGLVELGFLAWEHLSDETASPPFLPQNTRRLCCPLPQGTEHCVNREGGMNWLKGGIGRMDKNTKFNQGAKWNPPSKSWIYKCLNSTIKRTECVK